MEKCLMEIKSHNVTHFKKESDKGFNLITPGDYKIYQESEGVLRIAQVTDNGKNEVNKGLLEVVRKENNTFQPNQVVLSPIMGKNEKDEDVQVGTYIKYIYPDRNSDGYEILASTF